MGFYNLNNREDLQEETPEKEETKLEMFNQEKEVKVKEINKDPNNSQVSNFRMKMTMTVISDK